jgi:hypothetical protein
MLTPASRGLLVDKFEPEIVEIKPCIMCSELKCQSKKEELTLPVKKEGKRARRAREIYAVTE